VETGRNCHDVNEREGRIDAVLGVCGVFPYLYGAIIFYHPFDDRQEQE
jgi:hypothetical protein